MRSNSHTHQARDSLTQPTPSPFGPHLMATSLLLNVPWARHVSCNWAPSPGSDSEGKDVISVPAAQHLTGST